MREFQFFESIIEKIYYNKLICVYSMGIVPKMVRKRNLLPVDRGCLLPGIKRKSNFVEVIAKENN
jgi:hypothetical protein